MRLPRFIAMFGWMVAGVASAATPPRPNILVIMADDMGFADIGCYGSEIPTPNIDALAQGGLRYTQFYNTGKCCPTRASLLTGLYSHQAGIGDMVEDEKLPGYRGFLNNRCVTLGDAMRTAGYFTAVSGKWHVGAKEKSMWPLQRGFDRFFGMPEGGGFYFQVKKDRTVAVGNDVLYSPEKQPPPGWYTTDAIGEHAAGFIDEAVEGGKPFFLYVAHNAPHYPLQAPAGDIARFRGKYREGWDVLRERRHARQIELGIVSKDWPLVPRPKKVPAWSELTEKQRDAADLQMAIYAAMVSKLDASIGKLVNHLKQRGVYDNTLVLFLSDNGGSKEGDLIGKAGGKDLGGPDSFVYAGQGWATLQNTPFRNYKSQNHEGGISSPLIVHWPAGIEARGEQRAHPSHLIDFMPTFVELSGATYPGGAGDPRILPMEGSSLVPSFAADSIRREPLFWEHSGNAAVREGDWKLVRLGAKGPWELYNLKLDRTELRDLAATETDRKQALAGKWEAWARRVGAKPFAGQASK